MKALAALMIALAVVSAACGSDDDGGAGAPDAAESGGDAAFNEADVTFAQGMIPHHRQAVEMAELAEERAGSDDVRQLASRIEAAQDPEIETMMGWLEAWDEPVQAGHDMGAMGGDSMSGMMSDGDMSALGASEGSEFDRQFLEMMAEHHRGAVEMAETELAEGESAEALSLAEEIVDAQTAEIAEIEELLAS